MTVVEANVSGEDMYLPHNPPQNIQLLIEGIAQNTTGNVFIHVSQFFFLLFFNAYDGFYDWDEMVVRLLVQIQLYTVPASGN